MASFAPGDTFNSYADFEKHLQEYQNREKVLFIKSGTRKIDFGDENTKTNIIYHFLHLTCKQGKRHSKPSSKGIRPRQKSFKLGCEASIKLKACKTSTGVVLRVTAVNLQHTNHPVNAQTFHIYPENRRVKNDEMLTALVKANIGSKELISFVKNKHGRVLLGKDVQNLKRKILREAESETSEPKSDEFTSLLRVIENEGGLSELSYHEDGKLKHVIFLTKRMKEDLNKFPYVLIFDIVQDFNTDRYPLLNIFCIDSNGQGRPVLHAIMSHECHDSLTACLTVLKDNCPEQRSIIFVNRDFQEISAVQDVFPDVVVKVLAFHATSNVKKALQKYLTHSDVMLIMELFREQRETQSQERYEAILQEISAAAPPAVVSYFANTWWNCPAIWSTFIFNGMQKLQTTVTRCVENYVTNIKSRKNKLNTKSTTLAGCIRSLISKDTEMSTAGDAEVLFSSIHVRYDARNDFDVANKIMNHLTSFGADIVIEQLELKEKTTYKIYTTEIEEGCVITDDINPNLEHVVKNDECSCEVFSCFRLPCHHIFTIRQQLQLPIYEEFPSPFSKPSFGNFQQLQEEDCVELRQIIKEEPASVLAQEDSDAIYGNESLQFRAISSLTSQINDCLMKLEEKKFNSYFSHLEKFLKLIKENKPLAVVDISDAVMSASELEISSSVDRNKIKSTYSPRSVISTTANSYHTTNTFYTPTTAATASNVRASVSPRTFSVQILPSSSTPTSSGNGSFSLASNQHNQNKKNTITITDTDRDASRKQIVIHKKQNPVHEGVLVTIEAPTSLKPVKDSGQMSTMKSLLKKPPQYSSEKVVTTSQDSHNLSSQSQPQELVELYTVPSTNLNENSPASVKTSAKESNKKKRPLPSTLVPSKKHAKK